MTSPADDVPATDARDTPEVTHGDPLADLPQTSELGAEEAEGASAGAGVDIDSTTFRPAHEDPGATDAPRGYAT